MKTLLFVLFLVCAVTSARVLTQSTSTSSASITITQGNTTVSNSTTVTRTSRSGPVSTNVSTTIETEPSEDSESPEEEDSTSPLDIYLLVDTTKGMKRTLRELKKRVWKFVRSLYSLADEVQVGVGEYKDKRDRVVFNNTLPLQSNQSAANRAIRSLRARGGGRTSKEAQLYALEMVAANETIGFHPNATKIVVWIGDQPGKNPMFNSTTKTAINALQENDIHVIAINVHRLNKLRQATRIAKATGGLYRKVDSTAEESGTATSVVSNDQGTAIATGSGGTVVTSAEVGGESDSATSSDTQSIKEVILDAIETLIS